MSDRGIPASYRHMHGFGSHTFSFLNAKNERFWVKFHLRCQQGIKNLTDAEAEVLVGKDRESHQRDLFESIDKGDFPRWKMFIQVMPEKDAAKCAAATGDRDRRSGRGDCGVSTRLRECSLSSASPAETSGLARLRSWSRVPRPEGRVHT